MNAGQEAFARSEARALLEAADQTRASARSAGVSGANSLVGADAPTRPAKRL